MRTDTILDSLNPAQREAVEHTEGPTLVVAGAGSGKTRVLVHRIAHLIHNLSVNPSNILAVTFTNKAANEMKERIAALVGEESKKIWAGTFHSICARILRIDGDAVGLNKDFTIFDDGDQIDLVAECIEELGLSEKAWQPRAVLSLISGAKEKLISPEEFPNRFPGSSERVAARIYDLYEKKLLDNSALDFDDLIVWTVRLLERCSDVRQRYQDRFHYVHVDEYQDINFAQYRLIKLLADGRRNICCVGDDDQSIYKWRGADVGLILQFEHDYRDAAIFKLEQNYRSTRTILDAANEVVKRNKERRKKTLWTENDEGCAISVYEAVSEQDEAIHIANVILSKVASEGRKFSDFVVLYRMNAQSRVFEEVFMGYRVPYTLVGALRFYERKEVKDMLAYMRLALNPFESLSLRRIINVPPRGVGPTALTRIEQFAADNGLSIWEAVRRVEDIPDMQAKARREVKTLAALIEFLHNKRDEWSVRRLLEEALESSGYLTYLKRDKSMQAEARLENVKELLSVAEEFEKVEGDHSLRSFLEQVTLVSDIDSYDESASAVTLMTLHSAKGLEFPVVFMVGMEEGLFPHQRSMNSPSELEEERRLCYVGMTRAREELHFSYAQIRTFMGMTQRHDKSRFLREIPQHLVSQVGGRQAVSSWRTIIESRTAVPEPTFKTAQKVCHPVFGSGIVLNSAIEGGEEFVTVAFDSQGVKKLQVSLAHLESLS